MRKSSLQWSFSTSQFLSFKSAQEQGGSLHKPYPPGFSQRKFGLDMQGGSEYPNASHPWQPKDQSPEVRIVPAIIPSTVGPAACAATAVSITPYGPVVGSTDLKSSPSISTGPCQLTLFYNGSVCVYDNVSPEKAQAIMLLAGNGDSKNSSASAAALPALPKVQPSVLRLHAKDDCAVVGLSSPVSLPSPVNSSPRVASASAVATTSAIELSPIKSVVASAQIKCPEPLKTDASVVAHAAKTTPSAVPQARKASLARFLEKRKERVTTTAPYSVSKKDSEYSAVDSTLARTRASSSLPTS